MKTNNYISISVGLIAATLTLFSSSVFAIGLGVTSGSGGETWTGTSGNYRDRDISNFGFVLDSNVARDKTFNYRLSLMTEDNNSEGSGLDMSGVSMTHDWGFAIIKDRIFRLWVGPRLRIAYYDELEYNGLKADYGDILAFGVGPVIGLNIHIPRVVTFALTTAYLRGFYDGNYDSSYYNSINVDVDSTGMYFNASIIFRIRDDY